MTKRSLTVVVFCSLFITCSSSREELSGPLTDKEREKLDPQLHFLFDNPSAGPASLDLDIVHLENGGVVVGVDVQTTDVSKLREMKFPVIAAKDGVAVCRVDLTSLRSLLREKSVIKVLARKAVLPAK